MVSASEDQELCQLPVETKRRNPLAGPSQHEHFGFGFQVKGEQLGDKKV